MSETVILTNIGPFSITAWSMILTLGELLAVVLTLFLGKKQMAAEEILEISFWTVLGAVLGARLVYCLTCISAILVDFGAGFVLQLWQGGYTLFGAVWGGMLAAWLAAKAGQRRTVEVLDLLAPGAALVLLFGRLAERYTSQGLGHYLENEAFMKFPFGVQNQWEDWQLPVFFYEAVAALVILAVLLWLRTRQNVPGRITAVFLTLLSLTQIFLESLREDEFIRFGFVRFNQLASAAVLAVLLVLSVRRCLLKGCQQRWQVLRCVLLAVGIGLVVLYEFALDKSTISNQLIYGAMAATLAVMGTAVLKE